MRVKPLPRSARLPDVLLPVLGVADAVDVTDGREVAGMARNLVVLHAGLATVVRTMRKGTPWRLVRARASNCADMARTTCDEPPPFAAFASPTRAPSWPAWKSRDCISLQQRPITANM